ncbi:[FeFe] hydrogenase H-cluster radical SAM maturase HydG, partial [Candidatus Micrarchaeota archaeon]|nr:[FeFe] hydrogenase H-cluster radical SAM maturase HydG [Candidatus Micrarchaeota archaeon]
MIDEKLINNLIAENPSFSLDQVLSKAEKKQGLSLEESAFLLKLQDQGSLELLNKSANKVKSEIYGNRLVLFAPLYISDFCINDCEYCGFHCRNKSLARSKLDANEIRAQTELIIKMGHKRILLEAGEHPEISIDYVCDAIRTIYDTKVNNGEIRRVNVNIAATSVSDYKKLKEIGIG